MRKVRIKLKDKVIVASWFELPGIFIKYFLSKFFKEIEESKKVSDEVVSRRKKGFRFINLVILLIILVTCFIEYYPAEVTCNKLNDSVLIQECFDTYPTVIWWFNWPSWYRVIIWFVLMVLTAYLNERAL